MVLAVFVATVLIANLCSTPISTALIGAGVGTLVYEIVTKFKSPMYLGSCGATTSAVIGAMIIGGSTANYLAVALGGVLIFAVYLIFALIVHFRGAEWFKKIFPASLIGAVTVVIGLNLAKFIPTYLSQSSGNAAIIGSLIAVFVVIVVAVVNYYGKGFLKTISFLVAILAGFLLALVLELAGVENFGIIAAYQDWSWFNPKDFGFMNWSNNAVSWGDIGNIVILFIPVAICAALEHYSDHYALSEIAEQDLMRDPGLSRTLLGNGLASMVGTFIGGQPLTSYGESIGTIGFSKVASVWITTAASGLMILMGFFAPITVFINSIPSEVFAGCAMILYGYIAISGINILKTVDLKEQRNLITTSVALTSGISGFFLGTSALTGVSLAMVLGLIVNLICRIPKKTKED